MYRLGTTLLFAMIAALTAMVSALIADVRLSVVAFRGLIAFLISGVAVIVASYMFEIAAPVLFKNKQELLGILSAMKENADKTGDKEKSAEAEHILDEMLESEGMESTLLAAEADAVADQDVINSDDEFAPLEPENLKQVSTTGE